MSVQQGDAVLLHMNLLLSDGSVAETTRVSNKPSRFQLGDGSLTTAIEQQLLGLSVGDKKKFTVTAADGFGEINPNLIQFVPKQEFSSDIELSEGLIVAFAHPSGGEMPGVIRAIAGESVKVDFNHPLAGETLTFDIEIIAIDSAQGLS